MHTVVYTGTSGSSGYRNLVTYYRNNPIARGFCPYPTGQWNITTLALVQQQAYRLTYGSNWGDAYGLLEHRGEVTWVIPDTLLVVGEQCPHQLSKRLPRDTGSRVKRSKQLERVQHYLLTTMMTEAGCEPGSSLAQIKPGPISERVMA